MNRRDLLSTGLIAALSAAAVFERADALPDLASDWPSNSKMDEFVERYMRAMHAPGMTLVLADRDGVRRVTTYGLADVERKERVHAEQLFQIGSISKSFISLCLMQLVDEGKLDLHRPITQYLPWFQIDSTFTAVTTHHLLTHSSGLPEVGDVFLSQPGRGHRAAYAPGEHFHYNNMAFTLLGLLAWTLDGRELGPLLKDRIFAPLGMHSTEPVITLDMRERMANSYGFFKSDRPQPRAGRLAAGDALIFTSAAGSIASTPADMGAYIRMLARSGGVSTGRLVSQAAFAAFSHPHIDAREFGPQASYGYGIAVEPVEGRLHLIHTGGMLSFASALRVDVQSGIGAFASINAMQGYRPTPVVRYAVELMQAKHTHHSLPVSPPLDTWSDVNAKVYEGTFRDAAGAPARIERLGEKLLWQHAGRRSALEPSLAPDEFIVLDQEWDHFPLVFTRDTTDADSAITEMAWGAQWYYNERYRGPHEFSVPAAWSAYLGHYRNDSPWIGSQRISARKGQLWLNGNVPLQAQGDLFLLKDEEWSTEWLQFLDEVNGRCMRMKFSGEDLRRVMAG